MGEFLFRHHEGQHRVYSLVPQLAGQVLGRNEDLMGIAFGGSYAGKKYKEGDDVDMDLLFRSSPTRPRLEEVRTDIASTFAAEGLPVHIRAPLASETIAMSMRVTLYHHPNTPFITRNSNIAKDWGLR